MTPDQLHSWRSSLVVHERRKISAGLTMRSAWSVLGLVQLCMQLVSATRDVIRLGYLTGSQRLPGDLMYNTPGKSISGAISLAVDEINDSKQVMH